MEEVHVQLPAAAPQTYLRYVGWWKDVVDFFRSDQVLLARALEAGAPVDVPALRALSDRHAGELEMQARQALEQGLAEFAPTLDGDPMTWRLAVAHAERRLRLLRNLEAEGREVPVADEEVLKLREQALASIVEEVERTVQLLQVIPEDEPGNIRLVGEVDVTTADAATRALEAELQAGYPLRLDLSGLQFIDSTGLRMLITLAQTARSLDRAPVVLVRPSPAVRRILDVATPGGIPGLEVVHDE